MISRSEILSQTPSPLILPHEVNGTVQLHIPTHMDPDTEKGCYESLAVFVQPEGKELSSNAIQGRHTMEGEYLVFSPFFPWERGMTYVARTQQAGTEDRYTYQSFQLEKEQKVEPAQVVGIYPSANELPENLLRFYLYFNTPMKKGETLKQIQLTDASGNIDKRAFMEFKQELWSPDGKRLTILFDPGRIKRGVSTNRELGPALLEGEQYHLSISADWQDVYGQALSVETRKEFVVGKAYRQSINVHDWGIHRPKANSLEALGLQADRIMDHALVQSLIQIVDDEKNLIPGHWEVSEQEQLIQFIPEKKWQKGIYQIVIDSRLEDVAGNNLQNLLDQKETEEERQGDTQQLIDFKL